MPRSGAYEAWSSKNCLLLGGMDYNELSGGIDWRDPKCPKTLTAVQRYDMSNPDKTFSGRPHREEAMLVQLKGSVAQTPCDNKCATSHGIFKSCRVTTLHRGACGNCIWQSKAMECTHALEAIEAEAARKERLAEAKSKLLASKDAVNSSKRTRQTLEKQAAKRAGEEAGSPVKKAKAKRSGKKK